VSEEKPKKGIELPKCELNPDTGEVLCKVSEELYERIRKETKPVRRITFEVEG
jgi:hypothetical protein